MIVAYWIATNSWPIEVNAQAEALYQKQKGKKKGTAAAADQSSNEEPKGPEEASEKPTSGRVVVQDEKDPDKLLVHTVNPSMQALVIEGTVVTLDNIRSAMSKDRGGDDEQSIGGADEPWSMKRDRNDRRKC